MIPSRSLGKIRDKQARKERVGELGEDEGERRAKITDKPAPQKAAFDLN